MRAIALTIVLLVAGCGSAESSLDGAWISSRDLTLAELKASRDFPESQWNALSDPSLFGHMVHYYERNRGAVVFEGECGPVVSFRASSNGDGRFVLEVDAEDESSRVELRVNGDIMRVPIRLIDGNLHEAYTRMPRAAAFELHPCLAELFPAHPSDAV